MGGESFGERTLVSKTQKYFLLFRKKFEKKQFFFDFGWEALPPRPPGFWLGGQSPHRPAMETHPVHKYWGQLDVSCHPLPKHSFKVILICFYVISICCQYILTNKLLTQRGCPLPLHGKPESMKIIKNRMKTMKIQGFFKSFKFVVFLGCFTATWRSLEASLGCPGASWRRLGGS